MVQKKKEINVEIGRNIQELREKAGYTQEYMSELIGITPNHLSAIERGASGASIETIRRVCTVLGSSSDRIIFGDFSDDPYISDLAVRLSQYPPEIRRQVDKIMCLILETSEILRCKM